MPAVLTTASSVTCAAQGKVSVSGESKLKVSGNGVLLKAGVQGKSISACGTVPPPPSNKPCTTVSSVASGEARKLKVGGSGVLTALLAATSEGTLPTVSATANQSKLSAS